MNLMDVPDPTDFPVESTAPGLRSLDGSFRCDICGELYDAPVTISCGHCFCSACIRTALANKQECPSCRKVANEAHIRSNPVLEMVISDWNKARPFILGLLKNKVFSPNAQDNGISKKRKRSSARLSSSDAVITGTSRVTLPPSPSKRHRAKSKSETPMEITTLSSDSDEGGPSKPSGHALKSNDLVECPICAKRVNYSQLNGHIDNSCRDTTTNKSSAEGWSKILGGTKTKQKGKHKSKHSDSDDEYPLPIQSYTTLKDRQLKDMLQQYELPVTGDRPIWEQRHQRWVTIYNANRDKSVIHRKAKAELRRELKSWEEDLAKRKKGADHTLVDDPISYQITHKDEFAKLIQTARANKERKSSPITASSPTDLASSPSDPLN
ncbi:hypothetical protein CPB83DRAFT_757682 [Crepidotus variabilis]|uniref:Postreplication repair E3 ubiquitin-protein ligase RAD18 n=1 Tax=Crepidotus variabilis TaxID=179855 RepID=A0A9P6EPD1_9AGAR|nr:hypothetical protein CPB83DRAFT_757682 [Crepidotus variabilis]